MENTLSNSNDNIDIEFDSLPKFFRDVLVRPKMDNTVTDENFMQHMLNHYIQMKKLALELQVPNGAEYCDIRIDGLKAYFQLRKGRGA